MLVPLSIYKQCEQFAEVVVSTNKDKYAKRNQYNVEVIQKQILEGKVAEWGVWLHFLSLDKELSEPDMNIYSKNKKSFDADLTFEDLKFHIKSQNFQSMQRYGRSWMFQVEDPLFRNAEDNDWCVFCLLKSRIVDIIIVEQFNKLVFGEPKLDKLKGIKKVVYL